MHAPDADKDQQAHRETHPGEGLVQEHGTGKN